MGKKLTEKEKTDRELIHLAQVVYSWIKRHNIKHVHLNKAKLNAALKKAGCKVPDILKPCDCGICEPARAITEKFITYYSSCGEQSPRR